MTGLTTESPLLPAPSASIPEAAATAVTDPATEPGQWQAIHVYYGAIRQAMLTTCVKPLIEGLRQDGLIDGYFFINYWLEGPHLRLRLKPCSASVTDEVVGRAQQAIAAFLRTRPALYEARSDMFVELYSTLFDLEFTPEERSRYVGPDGRMLFRDNNTFSSEPYEPEYAKYGGVAGVALAEWHFQHSTDLVIDILRTMNVHLRTVVLGIAAQLMMVMSTTFLPDAATTAEYLQRYHDFWNSAFDSTTFVQPEGYDLAYQAMGTGVQARFSAVRSALALGATDRLPAFLRAWAEHCAELRSRVAALAEVGELSFTAWDGTGTEQTDDPAEAASRLLSPYMHMTNNRLGVTLADEAYLSHVLARALREVTP